MAVHEFGIMEDAPMQTQLFEVFQPEKYHCIIIDDDVIETILGDLLQTPTFAHTLKNPCYGLVYTGITLIPPQSLPLMLTVLQAKEQLELNPLINLIKEAIAKEKFIIHFGI